MRQGQAIRHDIDGLRAIAVLVVMFFHAHLTDFRGGFIGVDVFFVISGFLILPQITVQRAAGRFALPGFLARRVRRLVPALVPVLIYALGAATLLLGSGAYRDFLQTLAGAAGYVSNYVLMAQSGYFERTSDTLLLLHTWSLSVEFQFYLIAPLVLLLARGRMVWALVILALASFALAGWLVSHGSPWAFFGILPRFWELALGGLVGIALQRRSLPGWSGPWLRLGGLALILIATHFYRPDMGFPGMAALVPALGTVAVLAAPTRRDPLLWLLNSRVMQWIGTRSYSLYLWHWPLIVTVTLFAIHPTEGHYVAALLLTFPLAELSYRLVENPVRRGHGWRTTRAMAALTLLPPALMLALWGGLGAAGDGLRRHLPLEATRHFRNLADTERRAYMQTELGNGAGRQCSFDVLPDHAAMRACLLDAPANPVLVIGDSHGRDTYQALRRAFPDRPMVLMHQSGCAPADYRASANSHCFAGLSDLMRDTLPDLQPKAVILTSHWPAKALPALPATVDALSGTPAAIVNATPVFRADVANLLRQAGAAPDDLSARLSTSQFKADITAINDRLARMGLPVIDKLSHLCTVAGCSPYTPDAHLVWWDDQHLSVPAITYLASKFASDPTLHALLD